MKILMYKCFTIFYFVGALASFLFFPPQVHAASCEGVIITEILPNPNTESKDEWLELYNPTAGTINISSCVIGDATSTGKVSMAGYADLLAASYIQVLTNKIFFNNSGGDLARVLDLQGVTVWGPVAYSEDAPQGQSYAYNGSSWAWTTSPTPGLSNMFTGLATTTTTLLPTTIPPTTNVAADCNGVIVNELMPDPTGDDTKLEWVELYNTRNTSVDLGGCVITDIKGSISKYTIPTKKVISAKSYLVFYRPETHLSLNNDADGIKLLNANGVISESGVYAKALENTSFALVGTTWSWTKQPTPGGQNIIQALGTLTAAKSATTSKSSSTTKGKRTSGDVASKITSGSVKGASTQAEFSVVGNTDKNKPITDSVLGYGIIILSFVFLFGYTFWAKKDFILGYFIKK